VWDNIRQVTRVTRRLEAEAIRSGRVPAEVEHDAEAARLAAAGGMSLQSVRRAYQVGGAVAWQSFMRAVESVPVAPELRAACFQSVTDLLRRYEETLAASVDDAHQRESSAMRTIERDVLLRVRALLDEMSDSPVGIPYTIEGRTHLGCIVSGSASQKTVEQIRQAIEGPRLEVLAVDAVDHQVWWLWLVVPAGERPDVARLAALELPEDAQVAVGEPGDGLAGFRATQRQAGGAYAVAQRTGQRLTMYADVAVEVLALASEPAVRALAEEELAGIDGEDAMTRKLRRTLEAYFRCGQNASSAASRLGVNEQTVARHLRAVAERTGRWPQDRRAELELALRYRRLREDSDGRSRGLELAPPPDGNGAGSDRPTEK
jgi:DNA-binding PucR family transcriptional regulator